MLASLTLSKDCSRGPLHSFELGMSARRGRNRASSEVPRRSLLGLDASSILEVLDQEKQSFAALQSRRALSSQPSRKPPGKIHTDGDEGVSKKLSKLGAARARLTSGAAAATHLEQSSREGEKTITSKGTSPLPSHGEFNNWIDAIDDEFDQDSSTSQEGASSSNAASHGKFGLPPVCALHRTDCASNSRAVQTSDCVEPTMLEEEWLQKFEDAVIKAEFSVRASVTGKFFSVLLR